MAHTHLPASAGASFKPQHFADDRRRSRWQGGFFEVHAENYMGAGGPPHAHAGAAARRLSRFRIHGVGLSIGGDGAARPRPSVAAEDVFATAISRRAFPSIWPGRAMAANSSPICCRLPYTQRNACRASPTTSTRLQDTLGRTMLLENPATYLTLRRKRDSGNRIPGANLRGAPAAGCCSTSTTSSCRRHNHGFDAYAYLAAFPMDAVGEIHLAGHFRHASRRWRHPDRHPWRAGRRRGVGAL